MKARTLLLSFASSFALVLGAFAPAHAAVIVASPANSILPYFVTPASVTTKGGTLEFVNLDIETHNVVAVGAYRPDGSASWCANAPKGKCPLFWSPYVSASAVAVQGLDRAVPGAQYEFICAIHPGMRGTLVIAA